MPWPTLRRLWGYGIAGVLIVAVAPYPVMGVLAHGERIHRIHDTAGAIHYLLLWVPAVIAFTTNRRNITAWNIAVASALAMVATSLPSGDVISSLSWLPLVTLIPLWPDRGTWRFTRPDWMLIAATVPLIIAAAHLVPDLITLQHDSGTDVHGARFHYEGMAALYVALALCTLALALSPRSRMMAMFVGGSAVLTGLFHLLWPEYDSAIPTAYATLYLLCGLVVAVWPLVADRYAHRRLFTRVS